MQVEKARFAENIQHRFAETMREHSSCCTPPSTDVPTDANYVDILTKSFHKKPRLFVQHVAKLLNLGSLVQY